MRTTIQCKGRIIDFSIPAVMGILNVTPDSFYDGGKFNGADAAIAQAANMLKAGAAIIDVGGQSTRPGAERLPADEEMARVLPVIQSLVQAHPEIVISVDTFYADVARAAVDAGAAIVNDISAGEYDPNMYDTIAELKVPYIIMHKKGDPSNMQEQPFYKDVVMEIFDYLAQKLVLLQQKGIADVIVDPGFGFGKNLQHNYELLNRLDEFQLLNVPVLAGVSRKSMINKVISTLPENALNGTTVVNTLCLLKNVQMLRVHDVKEAIQAIRIVEQYKNPELNR